MKLGVCLFRILEKHGIRKYQEKLKIRSHIGWLIEDPQQKQSYLYSTPPPVLPSSFWSPGKPLRKQNKPLQGCKDFRVRIAELKFSLILHFREYSLVLGHLPTDHKQNPAGKITLQMGIKLLASYPFKNHWEIH